MNYPKSFIRVCQVVLIVMLVHVLGAVLINWLYNLSTNILVSHPWSQLFHVLFYVPVWIGLALFQQGWRFRYAQDWRARVGSVLVSTVIVGMTALVIWMNLPFLPFGFLAFLGAILTSLFYECIFYIPSILLAYLISWLLKYF